MPDQRIYFPAKGSSKEDVLATLETARNDDIQWQEGKAFSLVYDAGEAITELLKTAYTMYFSENALNPTAFPSLRKFESEVVGMAADLLGGDGNVVGNMTSGGTESCMLAVKTARDWFLAQYPQIHEVEIILPDTAHPAFEKAAQYFQVTPIRTSVDDDFRANVDAVRQAVTEKTALIVGSAPSYPHGVVDPITELAQVAQETRALFHVDACVGGFMLPFVKRLGYPVPEFDFRVPGVTSISADLHKYGYAAKGASLLLYRNKDIRRHQLFAYMDWSGGIYASPSMTGTRPAGPIAASWAIMNHLGEEGYLEIADAVMRATYTIREGIGMIDGVHILGDPVMSVLAIGAEDLDIYEVGDEMGLLGWHMDRQQMPPSLHLTVNYTHAKLAEEFLHDIAIAVAKAREPSALKLSNRLMLRLAKAATAILPERWVSRLTSKASTLLGVRGASLPERSAPMYGMMGSLPNRGDLKEVVLDLVEQFTKLQEE